MSHTIHRSRLYYYQVLMHTRNMKLRMDFQHILIYGYCQGCEGGMFNFCCSLFNIQASEHINIDWDQCTHNEPQGSKYDQDLEGERVG